MGRRQRKNQKASSVDPRTVPIDFLRHCRDAEKDDVRPFFPVMLPQPQRESETRGGSVRWKWDRVPEATEEQLLALVSHASNAVKKMEPVFMRERQDDMRLLANGVLKSARLAQALEEGTVASVSGSVKIDGSNSSVQLIDSRLVDEGAEPEDDALADAVDAPGLSVYNEDADKTDRVFLMARHEVHVRSDRKDKARAIKNAQEVNETPQEMLERSDFNNPPVDDNGRTYLHGQRVYQVQGDMEQAHWYFNRPMVYEDKPNKHAIQFDGDGNPSRILLLLPLSRTQADELMEASMTSSTTEESSSSNSSSNSNGNDNGNADNEDDKPGWMMVENQESKANDQVLVLHSVDLVQLAKHMQAAGVDRLSIELVSTRGSQSKQGQWYYGDWEAAHDYFVPHGALDLPEPLPETPSEALDLDFLKQYLARWNIEGIVFKVTYDDNSVEYCKITQHMV